MAVRRVLYGVVGLLMVIGGLACVFAPGETYLSFVWLFGVLMLVEGVATVATWSARRRERLADGWDLAWGIVSALFGLVLVCSGFARLVTAAFMVYYLAAWLVVTGVIRIVQAVRLRGVQRRIDEVTDELATLRTRWGWVLVLGVLLALLGLLCLVHPFVAALMVGTLVGVAIVMLGVDLVVLAFLL
jgi:uncharacterized membrane protein HdeD (DUF308 family)